MSSPTRDPDSAVASIAAAMGVPARAKMLFCLLDGRARTSTELALAAGVTPSTASIHLQLLQERRLAKVIAQGKHRYYALERPDVARALEALSVVAGTPRKIGSRTPHALRFARSCYDHLAGSVGVALHDRLHQMRVFSIQPDRADYSLTPSGISALEALGIDIDAIQSERRRFAFGCLDWSERRPHLGGALGTALLTTALNRRWVSRDHDSRALSITSFGRRELHKRFGLSLEADPTSGGGS
ncbi:MAG TPA: helix-turn-helix transcriptional regulator [Candidatus Eremiobacteraceae bacterium]|nr:helix-turn-helix transcriptional regulator [Candidatus Eremiobacteraceae bacterium]